EQPIGNNGATGMRARVKVIAPESCGMVEDTIWTHTRKSKERVCLMLRDVVGMKEMPGDFTMSDARDALHGRLVKVTVTAVSWKADRNELTEAEAQERRMAGEKVYGRSIVPWQGYQAPTPAEIKEHGQFNEQPF